MYFYFFTVYYLKQLGTHNEINIKTQIDKWVSMQFTEDKTGYNSKYI